MTSSTLNSMSYTTYLSSPEKWYVEIGESGLDHVRERYEARVKGEEAA